MESGTRLAGAVGAPCTPTTQKELASCCIRLACVQQAQRAAFQADRPSQGLLAVCKHTPSSVQHPARWGAGRAAVLAEAARATRRGHGAARLCPPAQLQFRNAVSQTSDQCSGCRS